MIPSNIRRAILAVGKRLRASLVKQGYGKGGAPLDGLCYVVCDVLMHLFPGRFVIRRVKGRNLDHYFLRDRETRAVVDLVLSLPERTYAQDRPGMRQRLSKRGKVFHDALQAHLAGA
jgi:hypothetical protein